VHSVCAIQAAAFVVVENVLASQVVHSRSLPVPPSRETRSPALQLLKSLQAFALAVLENVFSPHA